MSEVISEYDDVLSIDLEGSDFLKDFNSIFVGAITKQYTREIIQTSELIKLLTEVRAFSLNVQTSKGLWKFKLIYKHQCQC